MNQFFCIPSQQSNLPESGRWCWLPLSTLRATPAVPALLPLPAPRLFCCGLTAGAGFLQGLPSSRECGSASAFTPGHLMSLHPHRVCSLPSPPLISVCSQGALTKALPVTMDRKGTKIGPLLVFLMLRRPTEDLVCWFWLG